MKKVFLLLAVLPIVLFGVGCSGFNGTGSVSPLMFLLPGFGQTKPQQQPEKKSDTTASLPQMENGAAVKTL